MFPLCYLPLKDELCLTCMYYIDYNRNQHASTETTFNYIKYRYLTFCPCIFWYWIKTIFCSEAHHWRHLLSFKNTQNHVGNEIRKKDNIRVRLDNG